MVIDNCTFGLVLEQKVKDNEKNMREGFERVLKSLDGMKKEMKELTTEVMERPSKQADKQMKILMWLCGGMMGVITTLVSVLIYGARL